MIYVDYPSSKLGSRLSFEDNNLISVNVIENNGTDNWGDEDAIKNVTDVTKGSIKIDASIANRFDRIDRISFVRYNYYQPAYNFNCKSMTKETLADGSIVFHTN